MDMRKRIYAKIFFKKPISTLIWITLPEISRSPWNEGLIIFSGF
jgi:hypothetical protein